MTSRSAGRAAEPGQVADVGERGDQQRVDAGVVEAGAQARQAVGDLQRRQGAVEAATAGPVMPDARRVASEEPGHGLDGQGVAEAAEAGDRPVGHRRDHRGVAPGSRAAGLERCSSTTIPSKAARASWSDQE